MKNRKILFTLLLTSLCVRGGDKINHENINLADAEYCFDLKDRQPMLLFIKQNNNVEKRFIEMPEGCESINNIVQDTKYHIDLPDSLNKGMDWFGGISGFSCSGEVCGDSYYNDTAKRFLPIIRFEFQPKIYPRFLETFSPNNLSQYKDKTFDGYVETTIRCFPISDTAYTYKLNFRIKITGECESTK
jgi:hypothetical protein